MNGTSAEELDLSPPQNLTVNVGRVGGTWRNVGETADGRLVIVLDFPYVRLALLLLYSFVFLFCFFGNLAVLVVTTFHKRMPNVRKFILGHLAAANLCVALFCIYQSLSIFLIKRWILGSFLCKMYHFVISLSHAASVLILVVTSIERYIVIIHPIRNRWFLTMRRKRLTIIVVWVLSALLSFHKFYYVTLIQHRFGRSQLEVICTMDVSRFNHKMADMLSFIFLFVLPLAVICLLYIRIATFLRKQRSAWAFLMQFHVETTNESSNNGPEEPAGRNCQSHAHHLLCAIAAPPTALATALQARNKANRRIVKMLTIVAVCFALCNLPFHLRKILQNHSDSYSSSENPWLELVAPLTFLVMYANCAVSPFVHALLSKSFQKSFLEVVMRCRNNYSGPSATPV